MTPYFSLYSVGRGYTDVEQCEAAEYSGGHQRTGRYNQEHHGAAVNKQSYPDSKDKEQPRIPDQTPQPFEVERFDFDFQQESQINQYPLAT